MPETTTARTAREAAFLAELLAALDAMPVKELSVGELLDSDGRCCALGAVCLARGIDRDALLGIDDTQPAARMLSIPKSLASEIAVENDDGAASWPESGPVRWQRMRAWVAARLEARS